jgi:hypothetical protein
MSVEATLWAVIPVNGLTDAQWEGRIGWMETVRRAGLCKWVRERAGWTRPGVTGFSRGLCPWRERNSAR